MLQVKSNSLNRVDMSEITQLMPTIEDKKNIQEILALELLR